MSDEVLRVGMLLCIKSSSERSYRLAACSAAARSYVDVTALLSSHKLWPVNSSFATYCNSCCSMRAAAATAASRRQRQRQWQLLLLMIFLCLCFFGRAAPRQFSQFVIHKVTLSVDLSVESVGKPGWGWLPNGVHKVEYCLPVLHCALRSSDAL